MPCLIFCELLMGKVWCKISKSDIISVSSIPRSFTCTFDNANEQRNSVLLAGSPLATTRLFYISNFKNINSLPF